jgi:hypothetical protein
MRARDNPFRTERILGLRYRLQGMTWPELLRRCEHLHYRAAFLGPYGSGKTTLLEDLEPKLAEQGFATRFVRAPNQDSRSAPGFIAQAASEVTSREIILFDGAEQLRPLVWQWFKFRTRRAGGLIITAHQPGLLPTLWECRTSPMLLAELTAALLDFDAGKLLPNAEALFERHRGNLREALRECYDILARQCDNTGSSSISFCTDTIPLPGIVQA